MQKLLQVALATGIVGWFAYVTFVAGTTSGPDFLEAVRSGAVSSASITSIELVEPPVGHTPFTANEYDNLPRRKKISDGDSISRLVMLLGMARPGLTHQSHPVTTNSVYLKANCQGGFFWMYADVLQDARGTVLVLRANTRSAVNPNGASRYYLDDFSDVLAMFQRDEGAE